MGMTRQKGLKRWDTVSALFSSQSTNQSEKRMLLNHHEIQQEGDSSDAEEEPPVLKYRLLGFISMILGVKDLRSEVGIPRRLCWRTVLHQGGNK